LTTGRSAVGALHYIVGVSSIEDDRKGIVVKLKLFDKALALQSYVWRTTTKR